MKPLAIKTYPDRVLRRKCVRVTGITGEEIELLEKMYFTMKYSCGIGLAAPQIGISKRMIVAEVDETVIKLVNPEIIKSNGSGYMTEGCLSVPDLMVNVKRHAKIIVKGINEKGQNVELRTTGLLARVLQHEIDHLEGRLIIDYMTVLQKLRFRPDKKG